MNPIDKTIYKLGLVTNFSGESIVNIINQITNIRGLEWNADSSDNGYKLMITNYLFERDYVFLHVHEYKEEGNVLGADESDEINFIAVSPPERVEFVLADFSLLITQNSVLFCSMSGNFPRNKSKASYILNMLIKRVSRSHECHFVKLDREDVMRRINNIGIKEIEVASYIDADDYASLIESESTTFFKTIRNFFGDTETGIDHSNDSAHTKGIKLKARATTTTMTKEELSSAAARYVTDEEADDYKIVLNNKDTITPSEMRLVYIRPFYPFENSVNWEDVRAKMLEIYYNE